MGRLRAPIMDQPRHIHDLADELLSEIASFLDPPRVMYTKPNGKSHESSDTFGEASDLDRFRLVSKRFMRIGTPHRFSRFTLRFSKHGFRRLDQLLEMQLACYVKSFTYMVRGFYQGRGIPIPHRVQTTVANNDQGGFTSYRSSEPKNQRFEFIVADTVSKQSSPSITTTNPASVSPSQH